MRTYLSIFLLMLAGFAQAQVTTFPSNVKAQTLAASNVTATLPSFQVFSSNNPVAAITVASNGYVGIGTADPLYPLHVVGPVGIGADFVGATLGSFLDLNVQFAPIFADGAGVAGHVLTSIDGIGTATWAAPGAGTVAAPVSSVQFNSNGFLRGSALFTFTNGVVYGNGYGLTNLVGPLRTYDFGVIGYATLALATNAAPQHVNLQALFNYAATINGATVEFENGKYYYIGTNILVFGESITVVGNGATILRDFHNPLGGATTHPYSAFMVTKKAGSGSDYVADWSKGIRFEGLIFRNIGATNGLTSDPGYFTNLNGVAVQYNRRQNKQVNVGSGIYIDLARGTEVVGCHFYEVGNSVLTVSDSVVYGAQTLFPNLLMDGCEVRDWGATGVLPGADSVIKNCSFIQNAPRLNDADIGGTLGTSHAIYVSGGKANVKVEGCWIYGARYFGVQWYSSGGQSAAGMVKNCTFVDCKYAGTATADGGLYHNGFTFEGNYLTNCGLFAFGGSSGNTNQIFIVRNNHWESFSTNDGNASQIVFRGNGKAIVQGNLFSGAYVHSTTYIVVHSIATSDSYLSANNTFVQKTNVVSIEISGVTIYDSLTNQVFEFNGDRFQTSFGIVSFNGSEQWKSLSVRNCLFNCYVASVFVSHGAEIIGNYFLLNQGSYGVRPRSPTITSKVTTLQGNLFVNVSGATPAGAVHNDDAATNQLVMVNNYFGPGVKAGSSAAAAQMALFRPVGLFNGGLYGTNGYISGTLGIATLAPSAALDVPGETHLGTLIATNATIPTLNTTTLNANMLNLTNALGSNQVRLAITNLTDVSVPGRVEGDTLLWNPTMFKYTNGQSPGGFSVSGNSNQIPYLNVAGTGFLFNSHDKSAPGFGFQRSANGNIGAMLIHVDKDEDIGLVQIGPPNPASNISGFVPSLSITNRYAGDGQTTQEMVRVNFVDVDSGSSAESFIQTWRSWVSGTPPASTLVSYAAALRKDGQLMVAHGVYYPSNSLSSTMPTAAQLGPGGIWVGNSNASYVAVRSLNGTTTTMTVLVP